VVVESGLRRFIMQKEMLKVITIQMDLVVDHDCCGDKHLIALYLNDKLYNDPEFFGDFGPESIMEVKDFE
jgi:hypothetical protein